MNTKNKTGKFRIIFRFLKGNIRFFVGTLLFSVLFTACNALIPQIVKYTADHILVLDGIPDGLNVRQTLLLAALLVAASAVLSGVFNYLSKMCLAKGSENFLKSIRDTLYHHTQYLPFSWHVKHQTGEIIQRCTSDVEVIRNFVCRQLPEVFRICFLIVLYLGIMFSMNVQITLAAAAFFPVIIGYSCYFYSRIGKRFQDADEAEGALSSTVQENLTGVRVVRAFGREKYEIDRFDEKNNAYSNLWVYLGKLMSVYWASGDLITNLQVLVVMVTGVVFAVNGQITLGEFMAFISYNASLTWPVRSLGRIISDMSKAGVSMERVVYILEAEEEDAAVKCEAKCTDRNENAENIAKKKKAGQSEATLDYKIPARTAEQTSEDSENKGCGGYASLDYELCGYERSELVKLDILVNKEEVDALSFIVHADTSYERGRKMCEKLKDEIPRQLFEIPIQAAIGSKIIARETVKAMRKDVLAKCYGGDISRKKKLLEKQKEGKKRMRQVGNVEIPQKAVMSVLKLDEN